MAPRADIKEPHACDVIFHLWAGLQDYGTMHESPWLTWGSNSWLAKDSRCQSPSQSLQPSKLQKAQNIPRIQSNHRPKKILDFRALINISR